MRRVLALALLALMLAVPVAAQDATAPELQSTIAALQTQVATLQGTPEAVAFSVSGEGDGVVPPFDIATGAYAVKLTCDAAPAGVMLQEISGQSTYFDAYMNDRDATETEGFLQMRNPARLSGEIKCDGAWSLTGTRL